MLLELLQYLEKVRITKIFQLRAWIASH
jgi:hypothetical protein